LRGTANQIERRTAAIGTRGYKPFGFGVTLRTACSRRSQQRNQQERRTIETGDAKG
jgi:hypothetical protein